MNTQLEKFFLEQGLRPMGTLVHFGIKGMKWGIRRSDEELARANKASSVDAIRARQTLDQIKKSGSLSAASDADLNHLINRINTEKRFAEIQGSAFEKGHNQIKTLLSVGDTANKAISFANSPAGKLLASSLGLTKATKPGKHRR